MATASAGSIIEVNQTETVICAWCHDEFANWFVLSNHNCPKRPFTLADDVYAYPKKRTKVDFSEAKMQKIRERINARLKDHIGADDCCPNPQIEDLTDQIMEDIRNG